ncbi:MAG: CpsD/CapB family tyrosine-protein kinase [candidate division Zixibacteria bacterium]|nr:CpsD/CapB family tyrosine-protein kinase [candidate division Zixibacteria bacterium]
MKKEKTINLFEFYDQESPYATEFRRLLHNMNGAVSGDKTKLILITSAMLAEGKSTIASFLAMTAAGKKKRKTLLVDCDLRRPTIHKLFNLPRERGVVEALTEKKSLKELTKKTSQEYLDIVTAGKAMVQPTDIFDSNAIHKLLDESRFYYDLILVDCAPVLPVSDPMLLAPLMDGVIMVLKAGSTQKEVAERATMLLKNNKANFLGIVLNNLSNALPYYYNESYYGYEYKSRED